VDSNKDCYLFGCNLYYIFHVSWIWNSKLSSYVSKFISIVGRRVVSVSDKWLLNPVKVVSSQDLFCGVVFRNLWTCLFSAFRLALIQLAVGEDKVENVRRALSFVKKAKENGSHLIALPECFNSPYGTSEYGPTLRLGNFKSMHCSYIVHTVYIFSLQSTL
jgi:hypothetical protein